MRREPEIPGEEVPAVDCLDGLARITSEKLAPTHVVKNGTLQNACSTRPRAVADLEKSAHMHIVRLMNNQARGQKKNDDISAVAMLKKYELHDRMGQPVVGRDTRHDSSQNVFSMVGCQNPTYWERSTNFACSESVLILTFDRWNLVLQDRHIWDKNLHLDHVRAWIFVNQDLARNDHGFLWIFSWFISFSNYGPNDIFPFRSFPLSLAMRSLFLVYVFWNWKKVQCNYNGTSIDHCFFQEMPAITIDDAFTPVCLASFALRLRVRIEHFKQLCCPRPETLT